MSLERMPDAEPSPAELATAVTHRRSLWRQGEFMKLWTGQTISQFGNISGVILILYLNGEEGLGLSPGTIGLILALGNIGVIAGALTSGRLAKAIGIGQTIIWSAVLGGLATFFVPLAPRDDPFWFLVVGGVILGYSVVAYNVNQVGLRQAITPDRMLGRMNATMRLIVWGTIPIGALIGGVLGTVLGLQVALWVSAAGQSLAFLPVLLSPVRSLREIPAQAE